jgi:guanylate kinase
MPENNPLPDSDHTTLRRYLQRLEDNIRQVSRRLKRFEEEFGMDSEVFYSKLQNAELDERVEYSEWAGEHEMLQRLVKQRDELKKRLGKGAARK